MVGNVCIYHNSFQFFNPLAPNFQFEILKPLVIIFCKSFTKFNLPFRLSYFHAHLFSFNFNFLSHYVLSILFFASTNRFADPHVKLRHFISCGWFLLTKLRLFTKLSFFSTFISMNDRGTCTNSIICLFTIHISH